ncbi:MAG: type II toxin-antitoxin system RelE/ParE family toxin [Chromatiales bacterium]|nr:MAG: type II toxin-antitoxin system RelE/ParE family toxin [Chromatiales bacterium]
MKTAFTPRARREVSDIAAFYAQEDRRLGVAFIEAFERVLTLLVDNPQLGRVVSSDFRRVVVSGFPYNVYYIVDGQREIIEVSAV